MFKSDLKSLADRHLEVMKLTNLKFIRMLSTNFIYNWFIVDQNMYVSE